MGLGRRFRNLSEGPWGRDGARGVGRVVGGVGWDEYGGWGWHFGYLNNYII